MSPSLGQSRTIVCIVERRQLGNAKENFPPGWGAEIYYGSLWSIVPSVVCQAPAYEGHIKPLTVAT